MLRLCARKWRPLPPAVARRFVATETLNAFRVRLAQSRVGPELRNDYLSFLREMTERFPHQGPTLSLAELTDTMERLANSRDAEDLALARQLFHDMARFDFEPSLVHYNHVLRAMAKSSDVDPHDALAFVRDAPATLPAFSLWSTLIHTYQKERNLPALLICAEAAGRDRERVELAFGAVIEVMSRLAKSPTTDDYQGILVELQSKGIALSPGLIHATTGACKRLGITLPPLVAQQLPPSPAMSQETWLQKLTEAKSEHMFWSDVRRMIRDRRTPNDTVLTAACRFIDTAEGLSRAASRLTLAAEPAHWTIVIENASRRRHEAGLQVWNSAIAAGAEPTSSMAEPVIRALLMNSVAHPSSQILTRTMDVYRQVKEAGNLDGSGVSLCQVILNALNVSTSPLAEDFKEEVMEDIEERGIPMRISHFLQTIEHAISSAKSHQEALDAYRAWRDGNPAEQVSFGICRRILHHICCLAFPDAPVVPPSVFNDFVRDLVWRGYTLSHELYSLAFDRYAIGARAVAARHPARLQAVRDAVHELHQRMLFDLSITPDTKLWNRMMAAYSFAGDHDAALAVFRQLQDSGAYTPPSVSIAFDTCGFGQRSDEALAIRHWLDGRGYKLNAQNRTAYIECLSRCGELDKALDAVCEVQDGSADAINAANIALKFTLYDRRQEFVRDQLRTRMPRTWAALEQDQDAPIGQAGRKPAKAVLKPAPGERALGKWQKPVAPTS